MLILSGVGAWLLGLLGLNGVSYVINPASAIHTIVFLGITLSMLIASGVSLFGWWKLAALSPPDADNHKGKTVRMIIRAAIVIAAVIAVAMLPLVLFNAGLDASGQLIVMSTILSFVIPAVWMVVAYAASILEIRSVG